MYILIKTINIKKICLSISNQTVVFLSLCTDAEKNYNIKNNQNERKNLKSHKIVNYLFEVNWNLLNSLNTNWSPVWLYITIQYYIYHWWSCNGYGSLVRVQVEDQEWYRYWYLYSHDINTFDNFFQKFFKLQNVSKWFTPLHILYVFGTQCIFLPRDGHWKAVFSFWWYCHPLL